ncbi:MAG TPA: hypothetical protein VJI46_00080 [Candidatus Nanoarchaeia archaeon]|nr:hypothetical protein [Candidatus Nanoarchaeia archaeon]
MTIDRILIDFCMGMFRAGRRQIQVVQRTFRRSLEQRVAEPPVFVGKRNVDSVTYAERTFPPFSANTYRDMTNQVVYAPIEVYKLFKRVVLEIIGHKGGFMPDTEKHYWFDSVTNKPVFYKAPKKIYDILKERGFILDYLKE